MNSILIKLYPYLIGFAIGCALMFAITRTMAPSISTIADSTAYNQGYMQAIESQKQPLLQLSKHYDSLLAESKPLIKQYYNTYESPVYPFVFSSDSAADELHQLAKGN